MYIYIYIYMYTYAYMLDVLRGKTPEIGEDLRSTAVEAPQ